MTEARKISRVLISVSNKQGIVDFAKALDDLGVEIISTGGTARVLRENGLDVIDVSTITGFPEMMNGRVKTLHPKIHGALLALRREPEHVNSMHEHAITPIDMVVVNLYPFEETVADDDVDLADAIENIDIGGPAMIRSAAKNWRDVAVVTDAGLYGGIIAEMTGLDCSLSIETRQRLAALAFTRTASYDLAISSYLARQLSDADLEILEPFNPLGDLMFIETNRDAAGDSDFDEFSSIELEKIADLRYGENPHQRAALYGTGGSGGIANAHQLHGKEMSFNNFVDADAAWALIQEIDGIAVAIIKHTNPSGVGIGSTNEEAYRRALSTDPVSAFGGIVAFNRTVDAIAARSVTEVFTEVVIAPEFEAEAMDILRSKKNLRVLRAEATKASKQLEYKHISSGMLVQDADLHSVTASDLNIVTSRKPTDSEIRSMMLAWSVCKHVKSNAIVFANERQTLGLGAGQMNRVDSVRIAAMRAERFELPLLGSALASDAFFPFRDNVDEAARFGVTAIIQPGGSIKDEESILAANEHDIAMAFTSIRHFKH
ncbi:MAG: bifunctional phosphoribosylaminoimidazolecarboxamide formyltransferase/IMP cyclohydrolase [Pyrinomonadaceae bacterium]